MPIRQLVGQKLTRVLLVSMCLSSSFSLEACHSPAPPSIPRKTPKIRCDIGENVVSTQDLTLTLPSDHALTAVAPLVSSFAKEATRVKSETLLIQASPKTTIHTLLRVLLSAQEANLTRAYLAVADQWIELALPDSVTIPPLSVADLFFSIEAENIAVTRDLGNLGNRNHDAPDQNIIPNQMQAIELLLQEKCSTKRPCTHAALSANPKLSVSSIEPLALALTQIRQGAGSLRLVLSNEPVENQQTSSREDPLLTRLLIRETIDSFQEKFRICQGKSFKIAPAGGTVTMQFTVTGLGIVFEADVVTEKSTIQDPSLHACIRDEFLKMKFPKPDAPSLTLEYIVRL